MAKTISSEKKSERILPVKPESTVDTLVSWLKTIVGAIIVVMFINGVAVASFVVPTGSMERTVMTGDFLFVNKFLYGPTTPQIIPFLNIELPFIKFPGIRTPQKGDVIVFIYPGDRDEIKSINKGFVYYLKRCVATAGDTLQIIDKKLFVNGKESIFPKEGQFIEGKPFDAYEKLKTFPPGRGNTMDNYGPIVIPKKGDIINVNVENLREWNTFISREGHNVSSDGVQVFVDGKATNKYKVERDYCFGMGDNRDNSEDSRVWGFVPFDNVVGTPMVVYWSWDTNMSFSSFGEKLSSIRMSRVGTLIH